MRKIFTLFISAIFCSAIIASAETVEEKPVIIHSPAAAELLPFPGKPVTLTVKLKNTRDTSYKLRAYFSIDGKLTEIPVAEASLDDNDHPTYTVNTYSPIAEISYQFLLIGKDGSVIPSTRYVIRRKCIPKLFVDEAKVEQNSDSKEYMKNLVVQAQSLEDTLAAYDSAFKLIDEISSLLTNQEQK